MTGYEILQNSSSYPLLFLLVSSTDHLTGLTGASPTVLISKNGGSFATPSGAVSEIGNGWYKVAGNATDAATLGPLALHASATGSDPFDTLYPVVAVNPQSATAFVQSVVLAANGLGLIPVTDPGGVSSMTTLDKMIIALWRYSFKKATLTSSQLQTFADDGATVNTLQAVSDNGVTQVRGAAT